MIDASTCPSCGRVAAPPEPSCRACAADTETTELAPEGKILATTDRPDGRWVALVELEGGARLLAASPTELAPGEAVRLEREDEAPLWRVRTQD